MQDFTITLDQNSGLPPYRQIINQLKLAIATQTLKENDPLPSIREQSEKLGVAPLTVAKAYLQLEHMGLVKTRWGKGSFVKGIPRSEVKNNHELIENNLVNRFVNDIVQSGLDPKDVLSNLEQRLQVKNGHKRKQDET
ncbi:MAG: GntR family transcriptional regulator [Planctomycetota bacterium]